VSGLQKKTGKWNQGNKIKRLEFHSASALTLAGSAILQIRRAHALWGAEQENDARQTLLFGVDYYPDQTPEELREDAAGMARRIVSEVRIAEFNWVLMEPRESHYDFAWLRRLVEILHRQSIGVILGTPTVAPSNWLTQKYPEVLL
jgi:hypothetical protein